MSTKSNNGIIVSVIFSGLLIAGALVYSSTQKSAPPAPAEISQEALKEAIDTYAQEQESEARKSKEQQIQQRQVEAQKNLKPVSEDEYIRGNPDAPITIIEYSDFECPYCKRFHNTMKQVLENYEGQVNWVYRHFPLAFHDPIATKEAEATECVGDLGGGDKFWEYADLVYKTTKSNKGLAEDQLPVLAKSIGIDEAAFNECFQSGKYATKVKQQISDGAKAGVSGTPGSFIVDNKTGDITMIPGALPFEQIKPRLDALLK